VCTLSVLLVGSGRIFCKRFADLHKTFRHKLELKFLHCIYKKLKICFTSDCFFLVSSLNLGNICWNFFTVNEKKIFLDRIENRRSPVQVTHHSFASLTIRIVGQNHTWRENKHSSQILHYILNFHFGLRR
jgi:hypothetical protein